MKDLNVVIVGARIAHKITLLESVKGLTEVVEVLAQSHPNPNSCQVGVGI